MTHDLQKEVDRLKVENALLREVIDDKSNAFELMSECAEILRKKADAYRDTLETIAACPDVLIKKVCPAYHWHSAYERLAIDALTSQTPHTPAKESETLHCDQCGGIIWVNDACGICKAANPPATYLNPRSHDPEERLNPPEDAPKAAKESCEHRWIECTNGRACARCYGVESCPACTRGEYPHRNCILR